MKTTYHNVATIRGFSVGVISRTETGNYTNTYIWHAPNGYTVEAWYDVHTRSWVTQTKDEAGDQVLEADYDGWIGDRDASFARRCAALGELE